MNKLAAARKHHVQAKAAAVESKKKEVAAVKEKVKSKFGDKTFDHMRAVQHDFRHPPSCLDGHIPCSFCRIVQYQVTKQLDYESALQDRNRDESMVRRAEMRFRLLGGWSRNQGAYYDELLPSAYKDSFMVDISISEQLVQSLTEYTEYLDMIKGSEVRWGVRSPQSKDAAPGASSVTNGGRKETIDMAEIMKTLQRRKRILEVGHYAALFIQARVRKMCARKRVRNYVMRRFEFVPPTKVKKEFIIDKETHAITEQPYLIDDVQMNTPRTMSRRFAFTERNREARLQAYRKYISYFIDDDTGDFFDLFAMEEARMRHMRNFIALNDVIKTGMACLTRQLKEMRDAESGAVMEENSDEEDSEDDDKSEKKETGSVAGAVGGEESSLGGNSLALSLDGLSVEGSLAGTETAHLYEPVWISLAAPAPPTRELGITLALETKPVRIGGKGGIDLIGTELNQLMQGLERRAWESLKCKTPDEVLEKLLNENVHPPLQSCVHIADDDQNIWKGDSQIESVATRTKKAARYQHKVLTKEEKEKAQEELLHANEQAEIEENINKGHVLPVTIQLRPVVKNVRSQDVFRLFFVDGELCGVTAYSPWAYYSDIYKDRDILLNTVKAFATTPDMRNFVHSYSNRANLSLLKTHGFVDKNGLINFEDKSENPEDEEAKQIAEKAQKDRKMSIVPGGVGDRKTSIAPGSKEARKMSMAVNLRKQSSAGDLGGSPDRKQSMAVPGRGSRAIESQLKDDILKNKQNPRVTPLYAPPQEFLFLDGSYIDKPKLKAEEVVHLTGHYPFLKKMESWKPLLVKAQNEMFKKKGKAGQDEDHKEKSKTSKADKIQVRQLHASRLRVLNDVPEEWDLLGTPVLAAYNIDVPGGIGDTPESRKSYFESISTMSIHTDGSMIDRIMRPVLKKLGPGPVMKGFKTNSSKREEAERKRLAEEEAALKSEETKIEEARLAEKLHKLKLELPPLNLLVVEVAVSDETPKQAKKKVQPKTPAPAGKKPAPGAKKTAPTAKKEDASVEEAEEKVQARKLKMKLHQVIGIFSCDREINERPPPALDCGLLDWDHLLDMNDFSAYEKELHPLQWLVRPAKANYFLPLDKSTRPWSHPDASGTIRHVGTLESKKKLQMCLLGAPPEKEFLQGNVPRNIKTWLGMV